MIFLLYKHTFIEEKTDADVIEDEIVKAIIEN